MSNSERKSRTEKTEERLRLMLEEMLQEREPLKPLWKTIDLKVFKKTSKD